MEWVFQPLKPSSLTQRSSSAADHSGSLGASEANPPKRSGYFFITAARTSLASLATFLPTSTGNCSAPGEVRDRTA